LLGQRAALIEPRAQRRRQRDLQPVALVDRRIQFPPQPRRHGEVPADLPGVLEIHAVLCHLEVADHRRAHRGYVAGQVVIVVRRPGRDDSQQIDDILAIVRAPAAAHVRHRRIQAGAGILQPRRAHLSVIERIGEAGPRIGDERRHGAELHVVRALGPGEVGRRGVHGQQPHDTVRLAVDIVHVQEPDV
jgi:hypothetical protein